MANINGKILFQWNDQKYGCGISAVDEQHKDFVDFLNQLHVAVSEHHGAKTTVEIPDGLIEYTKTHFEFEEKLMRSSNYPGRIKHIEAGYSDYLVDFS